MHAVQPPRTVPRRLQRGAVAVTAVLALAASLLSATPAAATPQVENKPDPSFPLPHGALTQLGRGVTGAQVQESTYGGTVAVLWQTNGGTRVWARLKNRGSWGPSVRLSPTNATATRPSMDIDSNGSLLVGWLERRGNRQSVVAQRLRVNNKLGARRVFNVTPTDGPHVGAGQFQDVIAWTARAGGVNRPVVSVDAGAGFTKPKRLNGNRWSTFPHTLAVNSDGPQAHIVHLTQDTRAKVARASWAVLDPSRANGWREVHDVGPRQRYDAGGDAPRRPLLAFHQGSRIAMVFTNEQMAENVELPETTLPAVRDRWPSGRLWSSGPGAPQAGFSRHQRHLKNPHAEPLPDVVTHVRNVRGTVVTAHSGDQPMLNVVLRPGENDFAEAGTHIAYSCRPFPDWFLIGLPTEQGELASLLCVDNEADESAQLIPDLAFNPVRKLRPDARLGGTVRATAPNPLVPVLVVTEDLPGSNDPIWIHDLTAGGTDKALPKSRFTKAKTARVKGKTRVGKKLTAVTKQWSPTPARVRYRWFVGKKVRPKATKRTFKVRKGMRGKRIRVKVTVMRDGYANRTITLKAKGKVKPKVKKKNNKKKGKKKR